MNQTLLNSTGPASVLNFHLPNLIMRYVVGGGATNHPWPFPLTHFKLCRRGKASEQTMQEQTLSHIVLSNLDRSTTRGVERCLVCIAKCRTTSAVVVIRCLPLNYCERNRGCHLTDSFIGRCKGTGVVRQALLPSPAVLLAPFFWPFAVSQQ